MKRAGRFDEFDATKPVLTDIDYTVNGKPTGYIVYKQDDVYIIYDKAFANRLRRAGFVVQNTIC